MKERLKDILDDLRLLVLFPKRYGVAGRRDAEFWRRALQSYGDLEKRLLSSGYRWRVVTYDDGHRELAYLRVSSGGVMSGRYPAIYRGVLIPQRVDIATFTRIKDIRIAF